MRESGYYPPGAENDPRAPWNEVEGPSVYEMIEAMDGQAFYESGNHEIEGSLDAFDGRITFDVPRGDRPWSALSDAERALFEDYAAVVRSFAELYEDGLPG